MRLWCGRRGNTELQSALDELHSAQSADKPHLVASRSKPYVNKDKPPAR